MAEYFRRNILCHLSVGPVRSPKQDPLFSEGFLFWSACKASRTPIAQSGRKSGGLSQENLHLKAMLSGRSFGPAGGRVIPCYLN